MHASCQGGINVGSVDAPSGVRLSISVCPIELISPLHPCPVPTAPLVGTVQGVDLFAGLFRRSQRNVQVRVEDVVVDKPMF